MTDQPEGKKQKQEVPEDEADLVDSEEDEDDDEDEGEETEEMRDITQKLAQANLLIEESEVGGFEDKESVKKAEEIFQNVITINKDQIEGYPKDDTSYFLCLAYVQGIYGNYDAADSFLTTASTIDPNDDRLPEVREQVAAMKAGPNAGGQAGQGHNVPGLITGRTLTTGFSEALLEIFARFDKDKDNILSTAELNAFTRVVNGQPISKQTIRFMKENLDWKDGKGLTQEGFFQLYVSQTLGDPNETWEDLAKLGYNKNLEKI